MATLDHDIMQKISQLKPESKRRIQTLIEEQLDQEQKQADESPFDFAKWSQTMAQIRQDIVKNPSSVLSDGSVVALLREIRDGDE
jgi:hypothetical protein